MSLPTAKCGMKGITYRVDESLSLKGQIAGTMPAEQRRWRQSANWILAVDLCLLGTLLPAGTAFVNMHASKRAWSNCGDSHATLPESYDAEQARPLVRFVTGNPLKLLEINALLEEGGLDSLPFEVTTCDLELSELQDTGVKICIDKAKRAAELTQGPVLVEDTSLSFRALNGLPGPYIRWFLEDLGLVGLYKLLTPYEDYRACAECHVGWTAGPDQEVLVFTGIVHGTIMQVHGDHGFGWDSIFQPDGFNVSFADMEIAEKNSISHRSWALREFVQYVRLHRHQIVEQLGKVCKRS